MTSAISPQWWLDLTDRQRTKLAAFSPQRDGYVRWYQGETRWVCSRNVPAEAVEDRWAEKKKIIEAGFASIATLAMHPMTLLELLSEFYFYLDHRVETGKPKRLSPVTAYDYRQTLNSMAATIGAELPVIRIGPGEFRRYALSIASDSPTRYAVKVAYVHAFIRWALESGHIAGSLALAAAPSGVNPLRAVVGPELVKPAAEDLRDCRLEKQKRYSSDEIKALWKSASELEKIWIGLGINGAFDNADLGALTRSCVDLEKGWIDFRRRKRGKVRRVIPIRSPLLELMQAYVRPSPADPKDEDRFFLTPSGLPLQRLGEGGTIDFVNARWSKLMITAGLRPQLVTTRDPKTRKRTVKRPDGFSGDGRGYRGLRTTFPNLAPPNFREEVEIIMGHAQGTVLLDNYLETHSDARLRELVNHIWREGIGDEL